MNNSTISSSKSKYQKIDIDSSDPDYYVQLSMMPNCISMEFFTKKPDDIIQGGIDDVLGYENISLGFYNLYMMADDGFFFVGLNKLSHAQKQAAFPLVVEWFKKLYADNKDKFRLGVQKYLDANWDDLQEELDKGARCWGDAGE